MTVTDVTAAAYDESKHTRGSGDKGGQFVSDSMGEHSGSRPGDKAFPQQQSNTGGKPKPGQQQGGQRQQGPLPGTMWRGGRNNPAAVKRLQKLLKDLGFGADLEPDGQFGPKTEAAIKEVQKRLKMKQTGVASPALVQRLKIAKALSPCVGKAVKASGELPDLDEDDDEFELDDTVEMEPDEGDELLDDDEDAYPVTAAAGHDVTPGHENLHLYWTKGPGLARWVNSPTPWTTLLANLVDEIKDKPLETLKAYAGAWFKEVMGYSSGSDLNRVAHGHPPRGRLVGPG